MGNSNATVSATEAPKLTGDLLTDRAGAAQLQKKAQSPETQSRAAVRRSGSQLLRRSGSVSMRKSRMALQPRRGANFLRRRKTAVPPRRGPLTPDQKELLAAAGRGDMEAVLETLRSGVELETSDANEMTALHHAAKNARDDVVKCLVDRGANANATDLTGGFSPLHWVIIYSCPPVGSTNRVEETIIALARAGANVNATDFNLATPLHIAAQKGHKSTIDTLVRLGANPAAKDVMGKTCLEVAKNDEIREYIQSLHSKKESVIYHVLEVADSRSPSPPALPEPNKKPHISPVGSSAIYHVLEVADSRSPSPPALPEPNKKPRLSPVESSAIYHVLECLPSPPALPDLTKIPRRSPAPSTKESAIYHVLEVSGSRSPSPPALPEPRKPRLSPVNIEPEDAAIFRNLPRFERRRLDSPGYPAPPPPQSPAPHSRNSTPEYSVVDVPLPYKYRPLPLPPVQVPSLLYRYSSAYSSPVPPPPHAFARRRASRRVSNICSRPHRFH